MKIDSSIKPTTTALPSARAKPQQNSDSSSTFATSEDVRLSPLVGQLRGGETQPPIDSAKVEKIKLAISEGRFSVNAGAIADRLIDSARELLNPQRRA